MKKVLLILVYTLFCLSSSGQSVPEMNFKPMFDKYGVDGCFVLYDREKNEFIKYNPAVCDTGYIPASTFKIPHSLIALEEGIIKDTTQIIKWDGEIWPAKSWNSDQTLKTAVKNSCVWVYTGFASQIGIEKYYNYVKAFDYGNKNLAGPPTRFWLAGAFRISACQQIDFLSRFYNYELPVSKRSVDIVKSLIILEDKGSYRLSGKTGGGVLGDSEYIMWLVGYVEKDNKPYFYAMNFRTTDFDKLSSARYEITKEILRQLKLIE